MNNTVIGNAPLMSQSEWDGYMNSEFIYNYIDETYNVADDVRLKDFVSCFFDNDYIDKFLECASKRIN